MNTNVGHPSRSIATSGLVAGLAIIASCARPTAGGMAPPDEHDAALAEVIRSAPRAPLEERTPEDRLLFIMGPGEQKGFIDVRGRIVMEPQFAWAGSSSEGRALVAIRGLWGFVDGTGHIVIEPTWDEASPFSEGLAVVASNIQKKFNRGLGLDVQKGGERGYIDRDGKVVIAPRFLEARSFSEGVAWVRDGLGGKWGLIDRTGKYLIEPRFRIEPSSFSEGLSPVWEWEDGAWSTEESVERFIYVDTSGATVIPGRFRGAGAFSEGLAPVVKDGKLGFIDRSGQMTIAPQFEWGSVNLNTRLPTFSEGLAPVRLGSGYGFIDRAGRIALKPLYEQSNESAAFNSTDPDKEMVFREGLAAVTLQDGIGFIDKSGRMVIAPQFTRVDSFEDGIARVEVKFGHWGYIRRDGTFIWHPLEALGK